MKLRKLFAAILALTLLLTACGSANRETTSPQTSGTTAVQETVPGEMPAEELPIMSILLSSANGYSGRGSFIYITSTQIMTGTTTYQNMLKGHPHNRMGDIEDLKITEIPKEEFEKLCAELRGLRYDLLPEKVEPSGDKWVEDASDYYLAISHNFYTATVSEGYAAGFFHEGFSKISGTIQHHANALMEKYAPEPAEVKPIASIMLSSSNTYSQRSSFTYLSPTQVATGGMAGVTAIKGDPIANPGALHMKIADIPEGVFEDICAQLWKLRFDLLPKEITEFDGLEATHDSTYYLIVRFEDGTVFTSEGYGAVSYRWFSTVWVYLYSHANALMDEYEVPEKEIKEISAILNYSYNAFAAQNGEYGYHFYYYTPRYTFTGQTRNTPIDLTDPEHTENIENVAVKIYTKGFGGLTQDLRKLKPETLPETVEPDPNNVIYDGDTQCIVIYYADGTTITSEGYCATEYCEQFNTIWDCLRLYRAEFGVS